MDIEKDFKDNYFESRFGRIHYKSHVGGEADMMFLHGFAGSIKTWTRLMEHMPNNLNIHLVDLLGHGDSEAPDIDYTFEMHYRTVADLIDHLKLRRPFIFGHSYGGWLAAHYAIQNEVGGIILEDSAGLKEFHEERQMKNPEFREEMVRKAVTINQNERVLRSMLNADNSDMYLTRSSLDTIESKALIIWGGMDSTIDKKYAYEFKKYIFRSRLELLAGEKHAPHYTNPYAVAKLISDFVLNR